MGKINLTLIVLFISFWMYSQNDTIKLSSYTTNINNDQNELIFKFPDGNLIDNKVVVKDNCYTKIVKGIIIEKKCFNTPDSIALFMQKKGELYEQEEYGKTLKRTILNNFFEKISSEEFYNGGELKQRNIFSGNTLTQTFFNKNNKAIFSVYSEQEIPEFIGDTIYGNSLSDGLLFRNDTLFAIQSNEILQYKCYNKQKLISYYSKCKHIKLWDNGKIYSKKLFKLPQNIFGYPISDYFEYYEYNEEGDLELKVNYSNGYIYKIEKYSKDNFLELSYFLGQLQEGKKIDYFKDGYYITEVSNRNPSRKYKVKLKDGQIINKELIKNLEISNNDQDKYFIKTGSIITIQEYRDIENKILKK